MAPDPARALTNPTSVGWARPGRVTPWSTTQPGSGDLKLAGTKREAGTESWVRGTVISISRIPFAPNFDFQTSLRAL
jgi:hypothetical protein